MKKRLEQSLSRVGICSVDPFLQRVAFRRVPEEELWRQLDARVVEHFSVSTGNEHLYGFALISQLAQRAGNRLEVRQADLEGVRVAVAEQIAKDPVNPAVRDGFVQPLDFSSDRQAEDYYEGRAARPTHVALSLNVFRPELAGKVAETLRRVQVCVVLASSG